MTTTLAESGLSGSHKRIKRLQTLIFGPPGTWKTVTAHHMPRTRTLDFDDGMQSVEWAILAGIIKKEMSEIVYETINIGDKPKEALNRAMDQVDEWVAEEDIPADQWDKPYPQLWDTLIVDSASFMTDASIWLALHENKRLKLSKSLEDMEGLGGLKKRDRDRGLLVRPMRSQDWGSSTQLFMDAVRQWKSLGKNLIIIAHEYEKTDDEGNILAVQPMVVGQLRNKLPAAFDEVWYSRIKGQKKDAVAIFQTKPDSRRELKTRLGCLEAEEPGNFPAIRAKVAKFYGVPEDRLWTAYHGESGRKLAEKEAAEEAVTI